MIRPLITSGKNSSKFERKKKLCKKKKSNVVYI